MLLIIIAVLSVIASIITFVLGSIACHGVALIGMFLLITAAYYLAFHVLYALTALIATELFINLKKEAKEPSRFWLWHFEQITWILCFYGRVKIVVNDREKLPQNSRYLMVANHRSMFDPIVKAVAFRDQGLIYVSKPGNFKIPVAGKVMHKCGCLSLNRDNNRDALRTIKKACRFISEDIASVVIYPEGTRSREEKMLPFHAGSFKIAQKTGVPVVCAAVINTDKVHSNFPFKSTTVYIDIVDVIDAAFVKAHTTAETAEIASAAIQQRLDLAADKEACIG